MLAYVFWHWRQPDIAAADYESRQRDFHDALRASPSPGFVRSFTHAISGASWANRGNDAYEDWYLVESSAALDPLNDAAVSASRQQPHDRAALHAAGGTAGLYRLRGGVAAERPTHATWFGKPAGMTYPDFFSLLRPVVASDRAGLWVRQMTLGPATECCLLGGEVQLPAPLRGEQINLRPVWPGR